MIWDSADSFNFQDAVNSVTLELFRIHVRLILIWLPLIRTDSDSDIEA